MLHDGGLNCASNRVATIGVNVVRWAWKWKSPGYGRMQPGLSETVRRHCGDHVAFVCNGVLLSAFCRLDGSRCFRLQQGNIGLGNSGRMAIDGGIKNGAGIDGGVSTVVDG